MSLQEDLSIGNKRLAFRQVTVTTTSSNSWFMEVKKILWKYNLEDIQTYLEKAIPKLKWKSTVNGNRSFRSYFHSDSGSFRSYSLLVRSFWPGSFRSYFRGGSCRPNFGGSFRPILFHTILIDNAVFCLYLHRLALFTDLF